MSWIPTFTLFVMMLSLGMTLRVADFRRLREAPSAVVFGLLGQLVLLPAVAFAIAHAFGLSHHLAVGLVLIASCPGGVTSNVFSYLARGDVALSISLTAASSLVSFMTVPVLTALAMRTFGGTEATVALSWVEMVTTLFGTTALPVLVGMALLHWRAPLAERLHRPLLLGSTSVLMLLMVGLGVSLTTSAEDIGGLFTRGMPAVVTLVAVTMTTGLLGARALGLPPATARTLGLEIGIQNVNLALVVGLSLLGEILYTGAAIVYLPVMMAFAGGVILIGRRDIPTADTAVAAR